jgi:hypothetical protein
VYGSMPGATNAASTSWNVLASRCALTQIRHAGLGWR